jgi:hypothetical protein
VDVVWIVRVIGALLIVHGLWTFLKRPAKRGRDGNRTYSGQMTGWNAIAVGVVDIVTGALLIAYSTNLAAWFGRVMHG